MITLKLLFPSKSSAMRFGEHMADTFNIGITILNCPFRAPEDCAYTVEVDCTNDSEMIHYRDTAIQTFGASLIP